MGVVGGGVVGAAVVVSSVVWAEGVSVTSTTVVLVTTGDSVTVAVGWMEDVVEKVMEVTMGD